MKIVLFLSALIAGLGWAPSNSLQAQTLTTVHGFTGANNGAFPVSGVTVVGGTIYGTAQNGGTWGGGVVFAVGTNGTGFTILHNFSNLTQNTNSDGFTPSGGLILAGSSLYGTTESGGAGGAGTVFRINLDGSGFATLHTFSAEDSTTGTNLDGANPDSSLILWGNTLYGTCDAAGTGGEGTVFAIKTDGTGFRNLYNFSPLKGGVNLDGAQPFGGLTLSGSTLFGGAQAGGAKGNGTVYSLNTDGSGFRNLHSFLGSSTDGKAAIGALIVSGATLYGTTSSSGSGRAGTIFAIKTDGSGYTNLYNFTALAGGINGDGASPYAGLALSGGLLYGTTGIGGSAGFGTVFAISTNGTGFATLHNFTGSEGHSPYAGLVLLGGSLFGTTQFGGTANTGSVFSIHVDGSDFATVYSFPSDPDGIFPQSELLLSGQTLYGSAAFGGTYGDGTIYKVNIDGSGFTTLHAFTNLDGASPIEHLTLSGSTLYGSTSQGGVGSGGVFAVNTDGTGFRNLHIFSALTTLANGLLTNADGANPYGGLVQSGNTLYGAASVGGYSGSGAIYSMNTDGSHFTNLYNFTALQNFETNSDGANPNGSLFLSGGVLYGTAGAGGAHGNGTVFKIKTDGTGFSVLHNFTATVGTTNTDGSQIYDGVILSGGVLYGNASAGGNFGNGTVFKVNTDGTGFAILHHFSAANGSFSTNADGTYPYATLMISGNTLYGTANSGGNFGAGTLFAVNNDGSGFTPLYQFTDGNDGGYPSADLILSSNILYGTCQNGGVAGVGTVFSFALPTPRLAIATAGANAILTWPNTSAGFSLRATPSLVPPVSWSPVWPAPGIVNGQNCVTNAINGPQLFYQLFQ